MNSVPSGSDGSPAHPAQLVRRLHVDLCRLASALCSAVNPGTRPARSTG
ncbi:putative leader peptide [Actinomadura nitritigenes]